jgi:hypothetical protein
MVDLHGLELVRTVAALKVTHPKFAKRKYLRGPVKRGSRLTRAALLAILDRQLAKKIESKFTPA